MRKIGIDFGQEIIKAINNAILNFIVNKIFSLKKLKFFIYNVLNKINKY